MKTHTRLAVWLLSPVLLMNTSCGSKKSNTDPLGAAPATTPATATPDPFAATPKVKAVGRVTASGIATSLALTGTTGSIVAEVVQKSVDGTVKYTKVGSVVPDAKGSFAVSVPQGKSLRLTHTDGKGTVRRLNLPPIKPKKKASLALADATPTVYLPPVNDRTENSAQLVDKQISDGIDPDRINYLTTAQLADVIRKKNEKGLDPTAAIAAIASAIEKNEAAKAAKEGGSVDNSAADQDFYSSDGNINDINDVLTKAESDAQGAPPTGMKASDISADLQNVMSNVSDADTKKEGGVDSTDNLIMDSVIGTFITTPFTTGTDANVQPVLPEMAWEWTSDLLWEVIAAMDPAGTVTNAMALQTSIPAALSKFTSSGTGDASGFGSDAVSQLVLKILNDVAVTTTIAGMDKAFSADVVAFYKALPAAQQTDAINGFLVWEKAVDATTLKPKSVDVTAVQTCAATTNGFPTVTFDSSGSYTLSCKATAGIMAEPLAPNPGTDATDSSNGAGT